MKLNAHRTVNPGAARRWPRLNAGSRLQVEMPMTGVRHFRAGAPAVKRGGQPVAAQTWSALRLFNRAAVAARRLDPTVAAINQPVLAAA